MGKEKYQKEIERLFKKSPVVTYKSVERIVKDKKDVKQYTKQLIRNLLKKGKIKRITKGHYTIQEDSSLVVFSFKPAYLGLQDALSFHNLWEQETIPVIITTRKVVPGIRKIMGSNVLVRRIKDRYFFGFDYVYSNGIYLPYSDLEKTFIDMVYYKEKLNNETIRNILEKINKKKLRSYLMHYPKRIQKLIFDRFL